MVTVILKVTASVVIGKAGETVAPAGTVTEAGTAAAALLLVRVTTAPPTGAGAFKVTVLAVVEPPPTMDNGERVTDESPNTVTLKLVVAVLP